MARGKEEHQAYQAALAGLGRELARRARSRCELSGERGRLDPFDLEGPTVEPALGHVVLVSPEVAAHLQGKDLNRDALRYTESAVWNEEAVIRRAAVRILERVDAPWAREAIENSRSMDALESDQEEA